VEPTPIAPLPGRPKGIQGVVLYQGEFLPVLAWGDLPGCPVPAGPPVALAVLRPRLGLPLERLLGTVSPPPEAWRETDETDAAAGWTGGLCRVGDQELRLLDPDRLIAVLHRFREDR
jgi:chemotaxis signal transduction protein